MDIKDIKNKIEKFIIGAGEFAIENWTSLEIETHIDGVDKTTNVDKQIELDFFNFIKENFPGHGFEGEEFPELDNESEYTWNIDPIDGTKYYANFIPMWTITISLLKNKKPILGFIYNPVSKQLYSAISNNGAFLNDIPINVNSQTDLSKLQVCIDFPFGEKDFYQKKTVLIPFLEKIYSNSYRVRNTGSGTLSLAWLAQGLFGAYITTYRPTNKYVDIAGGLLIAKEAGASIYDAAVTGYPELRTYIVGKEEVVDQIVSLL